MPEGGGAAAATPSGLEHVVFAIAASSRSWGRRQEFVQAWWPGAASRGFVWLDRLPSGGGNATYATSPQPLLPSVVLSGSSSGPPAVCISRIVAETSRCRLPDVRWFVMGDDDTAFFPSNLALLLHKYDHTRFFYIGHPSESQQQSTLHSFSMAFGAGGFAISFPLAQALAKFQDGCLRRYPRLYGSDGRIEACTAELGVPLSREPGFHQIDLRGNIFGLLASHPLAPLVSLHHIDAVAPIFPDKTRLDALKHLLRAALVDPGGLLQQSICYDNQRNVTLSVSWGYAIQLFAGLHHTPLQLQKALLTFVDWKTSRADSNLFTFGVRRLATDSSQNPSVYYMESVQRAPKSNDTSVTMYRRNDDLWRQKSCPKVMLPERVKVFKESQSDSWILAPRRQCCEILAQNFLSFKSSRLLHVRVRRCKQDEVIAPEQTVKTC